MTVEAQVDINDRIKRKRIRVSLKIDVVADVQLGTLFGHRIEG